MTLGKEVTIEARITDTITENIALGLQGPGAPIEEHLPVGRVMQVILSLV